MAPTAAGQAWSPPPPRPPRPRSRPRAPALPPPPRAASGRGRGAATATDPLPRAAPHAARPGASRLEGPLSAGFGDGPRSGGFQRSAFSVQWTLDGIARRLQLRSGIQRIFIETLRMNQGLYLSKLGGLLFSLSLKQLRTGSDPSWAPFLCCRGSGAGFQRKSWAPGGPPGPSAQPISGSCRCGAGGLTSEDPGSGLGHRPPRKAAASSTTCVSSAPPTSVSGDARDVVLGDFRGEAGACASPAGLPSPGPTAGTAGPT